MERHDVNGAKFIAEALEVEQLGPDFLVTVKGGSPRFATDEEVERIEAWLLASRSVQGHA